ncbi:MAG: glycoside hydrolase family 92 protein [Lentimicrobium sp.]|nr:glycoside hydrolase family 92 protein [Lentimicrobium sp.]
MISRIFWTVSLFLLLSQTSEAQQLKDFTKYVNPFIGTGSIDSLSLSGSNFPGAAYPFGLVQLSPDTDAAPENPCSGYDYADTSIVGFSHTHLSGTGVADLFDFLFMPYTGDIRWNADLTDNGNPGYSSGFSHSKETASPGYYSVVLNDYGIEAELTATAHCGMHRYSTAGKEPIHLMIDLDHSLDKKRPYWSCRIIDAQLRVIDDHTIEGYRHITGWANSRKVYFRAEFSRPFSSQVMKAGNRVYPDGIIANHTNLKMTATFDNNSNEPLIIKVGLSSVSYEGARANLAAEISGFDFDLEVSKVKKAWNKELSMIDIEGDEKQKTIFYTALYHTCIQPNNIADVNGDYININGEKCNAADGKHYSTFSLWDTYRAAHPLYTIIQPERTAGFINSMLRQYNDYGYLPVWQLWGKETNCMIGNHAIPVIVDAYLKGIPGVDYKTAYEAVKGSSVNPHEGSPFQLLEKYQYFPEDIQSQSVSIGLEMAFNDFCVAQMARLTGNAKDADYFMKRAGYFKNYFDPETGFFRGLDSKGNWLEPFSPVRYGGNGDYAFTEGNAWQYLWYVPQDVPAFIELMGGMQKFTEKLDTFFTLAAKPDDVNGNASGFIGQYAHGNEPSHHIAYLYNFTDEPWKAQYYAAKVMKEQYSAEPSGYSGNEDCGQMSAWYIFSSMGFYPVNPANGIYSFGSPQLKNAVIKLGNDKSFEIITHNSSVENIYIQKIILNGLPYNKTYILHKDIVKGGKIEFFMDKKPGKKMADYEKPPMIIQ